MSDQVGPLTPLDARDQISNIKQSIEQYTQDALSRFSKGEDISLLLQQRSQFIDKLLTDLWGCFDLNDDNIALIAVGGYGRQELHPNSDIDLLILTSEKMSPTQGERISQFITLLWDVKLDIGHSVRTVNETLDIGTQDITVATNIMERRLVAGSSSLYIELQERIKHEKFWPSGEFYLAKRDEQNMRHRTNNSFDLEPNIKSCPGGLRDIQTIGWIAKWHFNAKLVKQLVEHGFCSDDELEQLMQCQNFLWRLRFALHSVANRAQDKLLFNYQHDVAETLGYCRENQLPVEMMMKDYYQTIRQVRELSDMLLQLFKREFLGRITQCDIVDVDENYQRIGHFIAAKQENIFEQPAQILNLFLQVAINPKITGIYAATLRQLRCARNELTEPLSTVAACRELFMRILKHSNGIRALSMMHKHGILGSYLPAWQQISGQMQFDLFHAYTVDEHTHRLLLNIERFSQPEHQAEFPLCSVLINTLAKKGLLVLAGIFHDIGKGRGGDHSELGAEDAVVFGKQHGLNEHDTRLVAWLVENHLVMSVTAQRRDIHDPDVINAFAGTVKDEKRLAYLYCLTVADICATNNNLWNSWKGSLLRELYFFTLRALRRGKVTEVDASERIDEYKAKAKQLLHKRALPTAHLEAIDSLWADFQPDYFLRHSPVAIANHSEIILANRESKQPLIALFNYEDKRNTELFVYTHDHKNLFAKVMRVLGSKNVQINDAHVMSSNQEHVLDTFSISELDGHAIVDVRRINSIVQTLTKSLTQKNFKHHSRRRVMRQVKEFRVPTLITFVNNDSDNTMFELVALDMPGLLATIGDVFTKHKIDLVNAKITTIGERVEDFFIITNAQGQSLEDDQQHNLKQALIKAINNINK